MKIAITSVGSLVGQNILDVLEGRRAGIEVVGVNSIAAAAGNFRCDRTYLAPPAARAGEYLDRIATILRDERPDVALPGRDDDVVTLSRLKEAQPGLGPLLPVGPLRLARVLDDKWESHQFARLHGLPFVDSALADDPLAIEQLLARHGFPLIAKPRAGHGSRGVRIILDESQCTAARRLPDYLLQPYLEPEPELAEWGSRDGGGVPLFHSPMTQQIACQAVIDAARRVRAVFCTHVLSMAGRPQQVVRLDDDDVNSVAQRYAEQFAADGWVGALNLQGRRDRTGAFRVYEANGRFTGGTSARTRLGFDEVRLLLEGFASLRLPPPAFACSGEVIVVKSPNDDLLWPKAINSLEADGHWQRGTAVSPAP